MVSMSPFLAICGIPRLSGYTLLFDVQYLQLAVLPSNVDHDLSILAIFVNHTEEPSHLEMHIVGQDHMYFWSFC